MTTSRIEPTSVATQANSTTSVSPTGTPMLPPRLVPWLVVAVAVAAALPLVPGIPGVVSAACGIVVAVGAALGIASPGLRKG